jgi:hypothetical protein
MGRPRTLDKRICSDCGSTTTYTTKRGYSKWHLIADGVFVCSKCNHKLTNYLYPKSSGAIRRSNEKTNAKRRSRGQYFRGKGYTYLYDIKCGVCNWCRAVADIDTKYTQLHHDENRYDDYDPLKFTLEICVKCHGKESNRLKKSS